MTKMMNTIEQKLGLTTMEFNSLFVADPGGYSSYPFPAGSGVAEALRHRFGIPEDEDLIDALEARNVITAEEAAWMHDA